ncbi:DUF4154 domain-containing protein [Catenovulum sp. SM1970]|uniref:YfiR/HmsC family protein n=1 Tax=Marinifaba aquimaris TaxID=2741323 RepID=UPI00157209E0|nr:YfiR/HmsC family protein [Marinifaba aquimaris]NTS76644.1 DUF4154 domain-containing protein [Marinifaba aquimaris]
MARFVKGWKPVFLTLCLLISCLTHAQNYTHADFKIALVGQFIKNIDWPNSEENTPFLIVVPKDRAMMKVLSVLDGEVIKGRKISVSYAENLNNLPNSQLIYFSKSINGDIDNAIALSRGKGTLIVTENSPSLHNVMINIIDNAAINEETYQLKFQINRPNMVFEQLSIKPELILHGGSELDIVGLYRETELAMQSLRAQNAQSQQQLVEKQQALTTQINKLDAMQSDMTALNKKFKQTKDALYKQNKMLTDATRKLEQVNLDKKSSQISLEKAEQRLALATKNVESNQLKVEEQLALLSKLEIQVKTQTKRLELQQKQILDTSEQLEEKSITVQSQAEVIDKQTWIILISIICLAVFISLTAIISKLFVNNKKISTELKKTLTELKNTQNQLIESEKLASLGQLVAGVAHEINTPIGVVVTSSSSIGDDAKLYLRLLEEKKLKRSDMHEFLNTLIYTDKLIQNNLDRCSKLIQNFKQISADQVIAENRMIKLKDYIEDVMGALSILMKRNNVEWEIIGDNPEHNVDPGLLSQILNNLVSNAITHGFLDLNKGKITIQIKHTLAFDEIDFIDNGVGMDEATRLKIFDPFFTTKRGSGGTGLGMNIVYNLATQKLGGKIGVESKPSQGTTIKITLPNSVNKVQMEKKVA